MKNLPLVFLIFIFLVMGCASLETIESSKIAPSEISQNYQIFLSQNSTNITATFYNANGATVDLDAPTKIELNGKEMNESKPFFLKGTDYHYSSDRFESSFQFAFYTADGQIYRNEVSAEPLEIAAQNSSLSRSRATTFSLSRAVAPNEKISFALRSTEASTISNAQGANNFNANAPTNNDSSFTSGAVRLDAARTAFTIEPNELEKFAAGKAQLKIEVSKTADVRQSPGRGGTLAVTYESQEITIEVVK